MIVPASIASAFSALNRSALALNAYTNSSLEMVCSGVNTPDPVMAALYIIYPLLLAL